MSRRVTACHGVSRRRPGRLGRLAVRAQELQGTLEALRCLGAFGIGVLEKIRGFAVKGSRGFAVRVVDLWVVGGSLIHCTMWCGSLPCDLSPAPHCADLRSLHNDQPGRIGREWIIDCSKVFKMSINSHALELKGGLGISIEMFLEGTLFPFSDIIVILLFYSLNCVFAFRISAIHHIFMCFRKYFNIL